MDVMAITFVLIMAVAVSAALGLVTWGLVLEARSNREWLEGELAT